MNRLTPIALASLSLAACRAPSSPAQPPADVGPLDAAASSAPPTADAHVADAMDATRSLDAAPAVDAAPPDAALLDASADPDALADAQPDAGVELACDGLDEDGDGRVDEGLQNACGVCGDLEAERCDGLDQDCDGRTDEGVTNRCGACGLEPEERCDGLDRDCDGHVDEGLLNACGLCGPLPGESCDGADNDCDGAVDERIGDCPCGPGSRWARLGGPGGFPGLALGREAAWRPAPEPVACWQIGPTFDECGRYVGGQAGADCEDPVGCAGCATVTTWAYAFEPTRGSVEQSRRVVGPPDGPPTELLDIVHSYDELGRRLETQTVLALPGAEFERFHARYRYNRRAPWHFDTLAIDWIDARTGARGAWLSTYNYHPELVEEWVSDDGDLQIDFQVDHEPPPE